MHPLLKRFLHGKLKMANSCWQTQVGVCERRKKVNKNSRSICRRVCRLFFAPFTHNLSLTTFVCSVKAADPPLARQVPW